LEESVDDLEAELKKLHMIEEDQIRTGGAGIHNGGKKKGESSRIK
jgi:hypothetical protein